MLSTMVSNWLCYQPSYIQWLLLKQAANPRQCIIRIFQLDWIHIIRERAFHYVISADKQQPGSILNIFKLGRKRALYCTETRQECDVYTDISGRKTAVMNFRTLYSEL